MANSNKFIVSILISSLLFLLVGCGRNKEPATAQLSGGDLCKVQINNFVKFKDPDSVKFGKTQILGVFSDGAEHYVVPVNRKNSYGGYEGEKNMECLVDVINRKVLAVEQFIITNTGEHGTYTYK